MGGDTGDWLQASGERNIKTNSRGDSELLDRGISYSPREALDLCSPNQNSQRANTALPLMRSRAQPVSLAHKNPGMIGRERDAGR